MALLWILMISIILCMMAIYFFLFHRTSMYLFYLFYCFFLMGFYELLIIIQIICWVIFVSYTFSLVLSWSVRFVRPATFLIYSFYMSYPARAWIFFYCSNIRPINCEHVFSCFERNFSGFEREESDHHFIFYFASETFFEKMKMLILIVLWF